MSKREDGWYWVRRVGCSKWEVAQWDGSNNLWYAHNFENAFSRLRGESVAVGPRIPAPDECSAKPRPDDITLKDLVRVAVAAYNPDNSSVVQLDIQTSGVMYFRQNGVEWFKLGDWPEAARKIRAALDFLEGKSNRTVIDVLKGA